MSNLDGGAAPFTWKPLIATFEVIVTGGLVTTDFVASVTDVARNVTVAGACGFDWEA